jgi:GNAT superfamily N-acetyltransferase
MTFIDRFTPEHPLWPALLAHLARAEMARWVVTADGLPLPGLCFLGAVGDGQVIGHISLKMQVITIPATEWSGGADIPLTAPDGRPLRELFVQTFAVDDASRRQGCGRALQLAALDLARTSGCYQVRSWSSLDKTANYALKLSLGFAAHPAIYETTGGQPISGVYFIKAVG